MLIPQTHVSTPQGFNVQAPLMSTQDSEPVVTILPATLQLIGAVKPDGTTIAVAADGTLSAIGMPGGVTAVTGVAPIASSGGSTPAISVAAATSGALGVVRPDGTIITVVAGAITVPKASASVFGVVEVDGTTITAMAGVISAANLGTVTAVTGTAPIASSGGSTPAISVAAATTGALGVVRPDGTTITISGGIISAAGFTATIASGTATLGTSAIASGAAAAVVTVAASGVLTTDNIMADFNVDPTSTVGYQPSANGMLTIVKYPTANNVNFKVVNNTGASITPGAVTLNWRVVR